MRPVRHHGLPLADWPETDQALWRRLIAEGDILDGRGPGAGWAPTTKDNTRKAYGYWLYWLSETAGLDPAAAPIDRITPARISAYIKSLDGIVASSTAFTYILDLLRFVKPLAPDRDWAWLSDIKNRLWARATPAKDKTSKIRSSAELFDLGLALMDEAEGLTCRYNPFAAQVQYRDGLVIALLAARPVRLKNLAAIEIGRHLLKIDELYWLIFEANEVKNRKHIEVSLPDTLSEHVARYLTVHRPRLLAGVASNRLWVSRFGCPLTDKSIRHQLKQRTEQAFGQAITPHLFRDCAATSIAIDDPSHVRMAATILGHYSLATTQRYYDQSQMLAAGRNYQSTLGKLRDVMRQETRGPYKPSAIDKEAS